jgi:hypothetical protein
VVTRYYKNIASKSNYSKLASNEIDLEDTSTRLDGSVIDGSKPSQD